MASLEEGMQASEVVKILGQPDDIKTQNDPGGINSYKTKEIWRYGTNGHLTLPTLGQVYISENDQVQYLLGNEGTPTTLFSEEELRCIMRTLSEVPTYGRNLSNPRPLIQAVNTLQPLGKEKALAAISEYLRITSGDYDESRGGIFFVLRLLFEIPEDTGYMPQMRIGAWSPRPPKDPKVFPLYPLVLSGDIPFDISNGYILGGLPQQPESHVEYFRSGVLRKQLLHPTNQPWQAMEQVIKNPENFSVPHLPLCCASCQTFEFSL